MLLRALAAMTVVAVSIVGPAPALQAFDGAQAASEVTTPTTTPEAPPPTTPEAPPPTTAETTTPSTGPEPTATTGPGEPAGAVAAAVAGTAKFVPITPTRILDTRSGLGGGGKVAGGAAFRLAVVGSAAAVPSGAVAVVLNLTVTEPTAPAYVSVYPDGEAIPLASSVNIEYPGQTVANLVTARLGAGAVRIYTGTDTHLVADVAGYYVPAGTAVTGRFRTVNPTRLLDTRQANPIRTGALGSGQALDLDVAAGGIVPRTAQAVVLNLTATAPVGVGYLSVTPRGAPLREVSSLNVTHGGQTVANQVIVPLQDGWVTVYAEVGSHVVIDLNGWYTGAGSASSADGLYVPLSPGRLLDTRDPTNSPRVGLKPGTGDTVDVTTAGRRGVPATGVAAVVVNATATDTDRGGHFTLFGAGLGRPLASNLNAERQGQTVPNHAVVPVSTLGLSYFTSSGAHLILDAAGYFTGTPANPTPGYTTNNGGPPTTGPHTYLYRMDNGTYARWDPCSAITYRVNYNGAPAFARSEVDRAVARIEAATGLDLVNLGDTDAGVDRIPPAGSKAVIAFVSPAEAPAIASAAGLGGGSYYTAWNGYDPYVAQGFVHINETLNYSTGTGPSGLEGLLMHELGHMIGLDHVDSTDEVMYPVMHNLPWGGYGPGDREGLWNLSAAKGCLRTGADAFVTQSLPGADGGRRPVAVSREQAGTDGRAPVVVSFCGIGAPSELQPPAAGDGRLHTATVGTAPNAAMLAPRS